jgi:hypothetical protein
LLAGTKTFPAEKSMTQYVRCVNNQTLFKDNLAETYFPHLIIGRIYKLVPRHENDGDWLRVIDGSGEDYLYPADYFEPVTPDEVLLNDLLTAAESSLDFWDNPFDDEDWNEHVLP